MSTRPNGIPSRRSVGVVRGPDQVGLVGFHDVGFVIARPAHVHAAWLQQRTTTLHERIGLLTNIAAGLRTATSLLKQAPAGALRRLWLLSDGEPNLQIEEIGDAVMEARKAYINVNTIGFGDSFNDGLLRAISGATHRGKFVSVQNLRQLVDVLVRNSGTLIHHSQHRLETTVIAIDLSASMREPMERTTKIAVVEQAVLQLLMYKQRLFA